MGRKIFKFWKRKTTKPDFSRPIPIYRTDINLGFCLVGDGFPSRCYEFAGSFGVFATVYRREAKRLPYNVICNQSDKSEFDGAANPLSHGTAVTAPPVGEPSGGAQQQFDKSEFDNAEGRGFV